MASVRMRDSWMPPSARALNPMVESGQIVVNLTTDSRAVDHALDLEDKKTLYYASADKAVPGKVDPVREYDRAKNPQYALRDGEIAYRLHDRFLAASGISRVGANSRERQSAIPARTSLATLPRPADTRGADKAKLAQAEMHAQLDIVGIVRAPASEENLGQMATCIVQGIGTARNNSDEPIIAGDLIQAYMPREDELDKGGGATPDEISGVRPRLWYKPYRPSQNDPMNFELFKAAMAHFRQKYFGLAPDDDGVVNYAALEVKDAFLKNEMEAQPIYDFWRHVLLARLDAIVLTLFEGPRDDALHRKFTTAVDLLVGKQRPLSMAEWVTDRTKITLANFVKLDANTVAYLRAAITAQVMIAGDVPMMLRHNGALNTDAAAWSSVFGRELSALERLSINTHRSRVFAVAINTAPKGESFDYMLIRHGY